VHGCTVCCSLVARPDGGCTVDVAGEEVRDG
jgi:hypothetical protein